MFAEDIVERFVNSHKDIVKRNKRNNIQSVCHQSLFVRQKKY